MTHGARGLNIALPLTMDIVYLVKDCDQNEELIYSLRSLRNLPHDKVFVVGGFPHGLNPEKIYHIPTEQGQNKYKNTANSLNIISKTKDVSDGFILMNDDFFIMSKIKSPISELNLYKGYLEDILAEYEKRPVHNIVYYNALCDIYSFLLHLGFNDPKCYELHIPMIMNKSNLQNMFSLRGINGFNALLFRTLYGNLFAAGSRYSKDVKLSAATPMLSDNPNFLSTSDGYFAKIKPFINNIFNEKSEYEL